MVLRVNLTGLYVYNCALYPLRFIIGEECAGDAMAVCYIIGTPVL